ncbi:MAG TPA: MscL family protein [candidate division Zixibacteria bacterium]|nr:MscL family protein [candidate division Zixibacteria bacterium]
MTKEDEMLEELKKIRASLEAKPAPVAPPRKGLWGEFMDFIKKYQIMGLAAGFIIALYLGELVLALVKDFIMPIIGLILNPLGLGNLATAQATVSSQNFLYGDFIVALITFLIVALVVFLLVKITKRWGIE